MNSKISLILSVIALLGVGYLLMTKTNSDVTTPEVENNISTLDSLNTDDESNNLKIAFIYNDSINNNVDFIIDASDALIAAQKTAEGNMNWKIRDAEKKAQVLIEESATYTTIQQQEEGQRKYQQLELSVQNMRESESNKLVDIQMESNKMILEKLDVYLKDYSEKNNIDYFFTKGPGLSFIYGKEASDVTADFINTVNALYKTEQDSLSPTTEK